MPSGNWAASRWPIGRYSERHPRQRCDARPKTRKKFSVCPGSFLNLHSQDCFAATRVDFGATAVGLVSVDEGPLRVDGGPSVIVRKSAAVGGKPVFRETCPDDEVAPLPHVSTNAGDPDERPLDFVSCETTDNRAYEKAD